MYEVKFGSSVGVGAFMLFIAWDDIQFIRERLGNTMRI